MTLGVKRPYDGHILVLNFTFCGGSVDHMRDSDIRMPKDLRQKVHPRAVLVIVACERVTKKMGIDRSTAWVWICASSPACSTT